MPIFAQVLAGLFGAMLELGKPLLLERRIGCRETSLAFLLGTHTHFLQKMEVNYGTLVTRRNAFYSMGGGGTGSKTDF